MIESTNLPDRDVLTRLVDLDRQIKSQANKHDRVRTLIAACIVEGIDSRPKTYLPTADILSRHSGQRE